MEPAVTTDHRNGRAEENALEHAAEHIEHAHEILGILPVVVPVDVQNDDGVEIRRRRPP